MTDALTELQQLLAEANECLRDGQRRRAITVLRRLASAASTLALTLELKPYR